MFGFRPRPPVTEEQEDAVRGGFRELERMLGRERMLEAAVVLPDDRYFPDVYDGSEESAVRMASRIAGYMRVDAESFRLVFFSERDESWRELVPEWKDAEAGAAGLYFHGRGADGRYLVAVRADELRMPERLAAIVAHELSHVLLLGSGLLAREHPDMEPLTDLATIYLGMGVFTANACFQFSQWTGASQQGWSTRRLGYLSEPVAAFALACFAAERGERSPAWASSLAANIRPHFSHAMRWLRRRPSN